MDYYHYFQPNLDSVTFSVWEEISFYIWIIIRL